MALNCNKKTILFFFFLLHYKLIAQNIYYDIKNDILSIKTNNRTNVLQFNISKSIFTNYTGASVQKMKYGSFQFNEKKNNKYNYFFEKIIQKSTDSLIIKTYCKNATDTLSINISTNNFQQVSINIHSKIKLLKMELKILNDLSEIFYGGGIQCSHIKLNGNIIDVFTEENGIGRGDQPITFFANILAKAGGNTSKSYAPIPFFISNKKRVFNIHGLQRMKISFKKKQYFTLTTFNDNLNFDIHYGDDLKSIYANIFNNSNTMKPLPKWAYKPIVGIQGGKQKINNILKKIEENKIKIGGIWIQDWVGKRKTRFGSQLWWNWEADESTYPNIKFYADSLFKNNNYKLLGYINPFVEPNCTIAKEKNNQKYFEQKNGKSNIISTPGFPALQVDLLNENNATWYAEKVIKKLINYGFSAWMADYGEWNNSNEQFAHHKYIYNWIKCNNTAQFNDTSLFFFNRAATNESTKYTKNIWLGDQMTTFGKNDGLPSVLNGLLSGGISGLQNLHADIGGYTNVKTPFYTIRRNKDLLYRSMELNTFTPIMRSHEGLIPNLNEQVYNNENLKMFKRMSDIHNGLIPYFIFLSNQATNYGLPYIRPLFFHYENDANTWNIKDEFLLGEDLLVAPILTKNSFSRKVYIPNGDWIQVWNNKIYKGNNWYNFNANYGYPILLIRKNSEWENPLLSIFEQLK
jgi:alpha-glucosidase